MGIRRELLAKLSEGSFLRDEEDVCNHRIRFELILELIHPITARQIIDNAGDDAKRLARGLKLRALFDMNLDIGRGVAGAVGFAALVNGKIGGRVIVGDGENARELDDLLAELGARAYVGMTYEPAMADGAVVDARKGSGNYSLAFFGRAAHVGRAFGDGRNAVIAAAQAAMALDALNGVRKTVGDVEPESVGAVAGAVTPVPGGVGPITVMMLLRNTVTAARKQLNRAL